METKNVIIFFGKKSILNRIIASIFYSLFVFLLYKFFISDISFFELKSHKKQRSIVFGILIPLIIAIKFSISASHHFNFEEMKYRTFYFIGPFGYGFWKNFKKLDRVSTFLNQRDECEVNIWDIKNNKYKIAAFDEIDNAVIYGRDLATQLNVKFKERK